MDLDAPLKRSEIDAAISEQRFMREQVRSLGRREDHIARIAYLVVHAWSSPIRVDFTLPPEIIPVVDGFHRIAAALYLGKTTILAAVYTP